VEKGREGVGYLTNIKITIRDKILIKEGIANPHFFFSYQRDHIIPKQPMKEKMRRTSHRVDWRTMTNWNMNDEAKRK
jgi:hypothetical protein